MSKIQWWWPLNYLFGDDEDTGEGVTDFLKGAVLVVLSTPKAHDVKSIKKDIKNVFGSDLQYTIDTDSLNSFVNPWEFLRGEAWDNKDFDAIYEEVNENRGRNGDKSILSKKGWDRIKDWERKIDDFGGDNCIVSKNGLRVNIITEDIPEALNVLHAGEVYYSAVKLLRKGVTLQSLPDSHSPNCYTISQHSWCFSKSDRLLSCDSCGPVLNLDDKWAADCEAEIQAWEASSGLSVLKKLGQAAA